MSQLFAMFGGFKPFEQLRAEAEAKAKAAKGIEAKTAKGREEERQLALCRQERDVKRQMPWKEMLSNSQKTRQLKMQKQELKFHAQTAKFFLGNDFLRLQIDRLGVLGCAIGLAPPTYNCYALPGSQDGSYGLRSTGHLFVSGEVYPFHHPAFRVGDVFEFQLTDAGMARSQNGVDQRPIAIPKHQLRDLRFCVKGGGGDSSTTRLVSFGNVGSGQF
jgi:hypothetical protein